MKVAIHFSKRFVTINCYKNILREKNYEEEKKKLESTRSVGPFVIL